MKTNVSNSSIITYHSAIKGKKEESENEIVYKAVKELGICTGRMIWLHLGKSMETSSIARTLHNLKEDGRVHVKYVSKCPVSGHSAQFYSIGAKQLDMF